MEREKEQKGRSLGIYVHIPFCVQKCQYCDFLSMPADRALQEQYCETLIKEIRSSARYYREKEYVVDTIFLGGGTPSILKPQWIQTIMHTLLSEFRCEKPEVTIECNPGTLDEEKLAVYKEAGINRISLGLQSAQNRELKLLGRIHTWEDFCGTLRLVKKYFSNWNVDIMSALPGQTLESYRNTLEKVLALQPTHVSAYSLIIEEGTPFYERYEEDERLRQKGERSVWLPDEETERQMYELTGGMLKEAGFLHYEISNYARVGCECRHNNRYWQRADYLGIGLGAASCMEEIRFSNTSDMEEYLGYGKLEEVYPRKETEVLSLQAQMEETMFLGLRRMEGVDTETFATKFGKMPDEIYGTLLQKLELQELIKYSGKYIQLTRKGIDVSNYVLAQFLLD